METGRHGHRQRGRVVVRLVGVIRSVCEGKREGALSTWVGWVKAAGLAW
jgi:hypothetical protein